jgi:uncharacterized protein (TIGR02145 family)
MINTTIGKYKINRLIGEGGMASVFEAEHEMLGTKVAIKVLNPILSANTQIRERFKNEAKMMASFNHSNITKIIDFDEQLHQLSIVMEFLEGEDLNDKIKRQGPLNAQEVKEIFTQTLSAFQYAHEKGVIHRDIKPSNIFILSNGHVKILDFGIAKLFGQGNEMTQTGTQMGTPIYMSPEQVKSDKSIDHRSDIYSLGVTMFYAIKGMPPYNSETDSQFDIFNKIVFEPLPELTETGNFDGFIKKACQKDREQRFQSCKEWLDALQEDAVKTPVNFTERTDIKDSVKENIKIANDRSNEHVKKDIKEEQPKIGVDSGKPKSLKTKKFIFLASLLVFIVISFFWLNRKKENHINVSDEEISEALLNGHDAGILGNGVSDIDGNSYKTVEIDIQEWMVENLNVSHFKNGDIIPEAKTTEDWIKAGKAKQPAWCYYENDYKYGTKYGKLYNWFAVNDQRGLGPEGWHIPTDNEWSELTEYLNWDVENNEGGKMKEEGTSNWVSPNKGASNISGFTGLPSGYRFNDGTFQKIGKNGSWWSSSEYDLLPELGAYYHYLSYNDGSVKRSNHNKISGLSLRCVKD